MALSLSLSLSLSCSKFHLKVDIWSAGTIKTNLRILMKGNSEKNKSNAKNICLFTKVCLKFSPSSMSLKRKIR